MTHKTITMHTDETGGDGEQLQAGQTYRMVAASADHWLKRGKAELVADHTKEPTSQLIAASQAGTTDQTDADAAAAAAAEAAARAEADAKAAKKKADADKKTAADKARDANTAAAADKSTPVIEKPADGGATAGKPTEQK